MAEFASKGVSNTGLGLGIAGTALGLMNNGGLANVFGGWNNRANCFEQTMVDHYALEKQAIIAQKDSEIALLKSEHNTNKKIADTYERLNARLTSLEKDTAVNTQRITDNLAFVNTRIDTEVDKIMCYVNGHFVPGKLIMPLDSICPPAAPLCPPAK